MSSWARRGLRSDEIRNVLDKDACIGGRSFVCAVDELVTAAPRHIHPYYYVVNTAPRAHPGKHWIGIHIPRNPAQPSEFWDSLGRPPEHYGKEFVDFLTSNGNDYVYSPSRIQGRTLPSCGHYTLYYLLWRCRCDKVRIPRNDSVVMDIISQLVDRGKERMGGQTCCRAR